MTHQAGPRPGVVLCAIIWAPLIPSRQEGRAMRIARMTLKALVVCVAAAALAAAQSNNDQPSSARGQGQPPQQQATAEQVQPDALNLLRNVAETYRSMTTFRAEANMVTEMNGPAMQNKMEETMTLTLGSQGKMRMESKGAMGMLMV